MGKKSRDSTKTDLSSFLCIILMLTGCLVTILISNVVVIAANPENVVIKAVLRSHLYDESNPEESDLDDLFPQGNQTKDASYVDVYRDKLILYPGEILVSIKDLEYPDNPFDVFTARVETNRLHEYIVMLIRPNASSVARRLKKIINSRGIDIGFELFEEGRPVRY